MRRRAHRLALKMERRIERRRRPRPAGTRAVIVPYRGFGRGRELLVRGRVLVEKRITRASGAEPVWRNVINAYRRFQSAEVPGAGVRARYRDAVVETVSDDEGYFNVRLEPRLIDAGLVWHEVTLELAGRQFATAAQVMIPPADAAFGIISDIDDTVLQTGATSLVKMARGVLLENAHQRLPFEGVADLYRLLHANRNPIFYVSSSPWNLYDLLHDFMEIHQIPHGPMLLQDYGVDEAKLVHSSHQAHKHEQINALLDYYPHLPFVLIGDSGQHDPEIYLDVIRAHPGRVRVAIIRDVTTEPRDRAVQRIAAEAKALGVDMIYVKDSHEALGHLERLGLGRIAA